MILRGIDFGYVWQASGATNFYGQGWWYHHPLKPFGLDFSGATFVAKTSTLHKREGNMPLKSDGVTPKEWVPKSIHVNRKTGAAVNAVSLSGPGLEFLLLSGEWQRRTEPFFISLMSTESTLDGRIKELTQCSKLIKAHKSDFKAPFGIQLNVSCPNVGKAKPEEGVTPVINAKMQLLCLGELGVPRVIKFGPDTSPETAAEVAESGTCDAIHVFNTIPWKSLPAEERIRYFGTEISPLVKYLGENFSGGVSGKPLQARLLNWIPEFRKLNKDFPINAGGGILCPGDAADVIKTGVNGVSLGSIAFLAPRQVAKTIGWAKTFRAIRETAIQFHKHVMTHTPSTV